MAFLESLQRKLLNKTQGAVVLFDIDDFNKINDELGHSELITNAGIAMAQVKKFGKDGFCHYSEMGN